MSDRNVLKNYFNTGDKPTETQFADLIDSLVHIDDSIIKSIKNASIPYQGNEIPLDSVILRYSKDINTGEEIRMINSSAILYGKAKKIVKSATKPVLPSNVSVISGFFEPNIELEYEFTCVYVDQNTPGNNLYELKISGNKLRITKAQGRQLNIQHKIEGFSGLNFWISPSGGNKIFELKYKKTLNHISQIVLKLNRSYVVNPAYIEVSNYQTNSNYDRLKFLYGNRALYDSLIARHYREGDYEVFQFEFGNYPSINIESMTVREVGLAIETYEFKIVDTSLGNNIPRLN